MKYISIFLAIMLALLVVRSFKSSEIARNLEDRIITLEQNHEILDLKLQEVNSKVNEIK